MKWIILLLLLMPLAVNAQDAAFKEDVQQLMKVMGVPDRIAATREYEAMWVPPDKEKEQLAKVDATIPEFLKNVEAYFLDSYTHKEVKELLAFYNTPLGRKITANMAKMIADFNEADDKWGDTFIDIYFKYKKETKKK